MWHHFLAEKEVCYRDYSHFLSTKIDDSRSISWNEMVNGTRLLAGNQMWQCEYLVYLIVTSVALHIKYSVMQTHFHFLYTKVEYILKRKGEGSTFASRQPAGICYCCCYLPPPLSLFYSGHSTCLTPYFRFFLSFHHLTLDFDSALKALSLFNITTINSEN